MAATTSQESLKLEGLVRDEVSRQFSTQREIFNDAIGLAAKIVGVALAVLVGIFTVLGFTTWDDIEEQAASIVNERAENLIQNANSEANVQTTLTNLLNRAVVASVLARHARNEDDEIDLSYADSSRLQSWIAEETLELQDFTDALAVLNLQDDARKRANANKVLARLLEPKTQGEYEWIREQPEKIEAIVSTFKHPDLASKVISLVGSGSYSDETKLQAARYAREVGYEDGVPTLLRAQKEMIWGDLKRTLIESSVALRPDLPEVVEVLEQLLNDSPSYERQRAALHTLRILWSPDPPFDASLDVSKTQQLGPRLLSFVLDNGGRIELRPNGGFPGSRLLSSVESRADIKPEAPAVMVMLPAKGMTIGSLMTFKELAALEPLWTTASKAAVAGQIDRLGKLLPRFSQSPVNRFLSTLEVGYFIDGTNDLVVVVERKDLPDLSLKLHEIKAVYISARRNADELPVSWTDASGVVHMASLKSIQGTEVKISMRTLRPSKTAEI